MVGQAVSCSVATQVHTMDFAVIANLALACAPQVAVGTVQALVHVESAGNPNAIGVVGNALVRQPRTTAEARSTAQALVARKQNFSVGLAQINVRNFGRLGLSLDSALSPCENLRAMQTILLECYERATQSAESADRRAQQQAQDRLRDALSCYYSGNFSTGYRHGYVQRVLSAARPPSLPSHQPKEFP